MASDQEPQQEPLFAGVKAETARLFADVASLAQLRWQLARLEAITAARSLRRLAVVLLLAAIVALVGLPVLVVALADVLADLWGVPRWGWLAIFGLGLLAAAALTAWLQWRAFRRRFAGFEQTIEEMREDLIWLRERWGAERGDAETERRGDAGEEGRGDAAPLRGDAESDHYEN